MQEENVSEQKRENAGEGAPSLGKFKSVDALVRAYGELESEFTRRSQRLRQLEEENESLRTPKQGEEADRAEARASDEELYRAVNENEGVRARVLGDYLQSLKGVPLMAGGGAGVAAPSVKAKSIAEAGKLALGYLRSQKNG